MQARRYQEALTAFGELIKRQPRDPTGYHGTGVVYCFLGDKKKGREQLEGALSRALGQPSRALVWNFAAAHLEEEPMRAARIVRDYLSRPGSPDDEEMLNMFGAALFGSKPEERRTSFFAECRTLYFKKDEALRVKRNDGTKRWGTQWMTDSVAEQKWSALIGASAEVDRLRVEAPRAAKARQKAWDRIQDLQSTLALVSNAEKRSARDIWQAADKHAQKMQQELTQAERKLSACEQPPFPRSMEFKPVAEEY